MRVHTEQGSGWGRGTPALEHLWMCAQCLNIPPVPLFHFGFKILIELLRTPGLETPGRGRARQTEPLPGATRATNLGGVL